MKKVRTFLFYFSLLAAIYLSFISCRKQDTITTSRQKPEKVLTAIFSGRGGQQSRLRTIRLYKDTVYVLTESFSRIAGEQLVIDAGTIIKMAPGIQVDIEPGAFIAANGSASKPIIFTTNLPTGSKGAQWNGIKIKGKSANNATGSQGDPSDNSGSMQFVRIEFGSLTLESVGDGTVINHVQVSYSGTQSSFRFSGGGFNARYLVSYACGGSSDFYVTNGYQGKIQYLMAQRHPFFGQYTNDPPAVFTGLYISNNEFNNISAIPKTELIISNLTIMGPDTQTGTKPEYLDSTNGGNTAAMVTSANAGFQIRNAALLGFPLSSWIITDSNTANSVNFLRAQFTSSVVQSGVPKWVFFIRPGVYRRYQSSDFLDFMLEPRFKNRVYNTVDDFQLEDPFNYDEPDLVPKTNSSLLFGADFTGLVFSDPFFAKTEFIGAFGRDNWTIGWTNFIPLKTYYNPPR
jgi:hypothetical protein